LDTALSFAAALIGAFVGAWASVRTVVDASRIKWIDTLREDVSELLVMARREAILAIAGRYGARNVRVFGSVVRSEADAGSDVDFLVELEPGRSLFDLGGLLMDLQEHLHCKVDVMTPAMLKPRIREQILREAMLL
jgi:uncharacterized protein